MTFKQKIIKKIMEFLYMIHTKINLLSIIFIKINTVGKKGILVPVK